MAPKHIGIIMDGNRRWAKEKGLKAWEGHEFGAKKVEKLFEWVTDLDIKETTLYAFSTENFNRSKTEVNAMMDLLRVWLNKLKHEKKIDQHGVKIQFIGRLGMFPDDIEQQMYDIMHQTKKNKRVIVNFAVGYGGRAEITDMVKQIAADVKDSNLSANDIDEKYIQDQLYLSNDMDLIIRTGGAKRLSNFFPWIGAYAELFFIEKYWPDFSKADLSKILKEFEERERRMGK